MSAWLWLILPALYALAVWRLGVALARLARMKGPTSEAGLSLSVIIACRNEEELVGDTLAALRSQTLEHEKLQLIAIDDGSSDSTSQVLQDAAALPGPELQVLATDPEQRGKKVAILKGLEQARGSIIAILDADTVVSPQWAESLLSAFSERTGLVAGAAVFHAEPRDPTYSENSTLFQRVLRLEYMGLLGAGLAGFAMDRPFFASGANIAWRRQAFEDAGGFEGIAHIASGDDTLLIQRMARRTQWKLRPWLAAEARVRTRAPQNLAQFLRQRARWTSTGGDYPDPIAILAALAAFALFLELPLVLILAVLGQLPAWVALGVWLLKLLPDAWFTSRAARALGGSTLVHLFPLAWLGQLCYGLWVPWQARLALLRWRTP
ncbi:MAG: glycosyltransferase [Calditrichaeota bacterium]|nr:glycosyltransferase [Calditrichota bacterium]